MLPRINNNIVTELLINPAYRLYRHFMLWVSILIMTLSFIWYIPEELASFPHKMIGWGCYILVFGSSIYLNIYFFIPRLLLSNRLASYLIAILLTIVFVVFCIVVIQLFFFRLDVLFNQRPSPIIWLNVLGSVVIITLMFAGITTLVLFKRWINDNQQVSELESSTYRTELKLLRNQINPHFLFNMLNNANFLLAKNKEEASRVLFKLEDLLRYQIGDTTREKVWLSSEIHFLNDYLNLEKIRRDRFDYRIDKEGDINRIEIAPLLFIIFVENAVKHNPESENQSYVHLSFKEKKGNMEFVCENSKPPVNYPQVRKGGLGLKNIQRRLELLYPGRHTLDIQEETTKYTVKLELMI